VWIYFAFFTITNTYMQKFLQIKQFFYFLLFTLVANLSFGQASGDYRTKNTTLGPHAWATAGNWEKHNGTTWATATSAPTSADGVITIRTGSSYTFSIGTVAIDQVVIENGGTLTYSGGTLTVADGTGDDLVINSGGKFVNSSNAFPINTTFVPTLTARVRVKTGVFGNLLQIIQVDRMIGLIHPIQDVFGKIVLLSDGQLLMLTIHLMLLISILLQQLIDLYGNLTLIL
jgi:hypothetical protein